MPNTLHAHSEYLEVGAEMGIVGLAVLLWAIGAFLWESAQKAVRAPTEWQQLAIAGLVAGCVAILLQAAVSVTTRWIVGRFFLWLGIGLTVGVGFIIDASVEPGFGQNRRNVECLLRISNSLAASCRSA